MEGKKIFVQIQDIADAMCDRYCKWPVNGRYKIRKDMTLEEETAVIDLLLSEKCNDCPLNQLL